MLTRIIRFGAVILSGSLTILQAGESQNSPGETAPRTPRIQQDARPARFRHGHVGGLPWHRVIQNPDVAERLGLDEEQLTAIRAQLEETGRQMTEMRTAIEAAALQQAELMLQTPINEQAVMEVISDIGALRTQIDQLRVREIIFLRRSLTEEQQARAREMAAGHFRRQRQRSLREREPDGPPGLPPRPERRREP